MGYIQGVQVCELAYVLSFLKYSLSTKHSQPNREVKHPHKSHCRLTSYFIIPYSVITLITCIHWILETTGPKRQALRTESLESRNWKDIRVKGRHKQIRLRIRFQPALKDPIQEPFSSRETPTAVQRALSSFLPTITTIKGQQPKQWQHEWSAVSEGAGDPTNSFWQWPISKS